MFTTHNRIRSVLLLLYYYCDIVNSKYKYKIYNKTSITNAGRFVPNNKSFFFAFLITGDKGWYQLKYVTIQLLI